MKKNLNSDLNLKTVSQENNANTQEFFVEGMHCAACELVVEKKLSKHPQVKQVKANLSTNKVVIERKENTDGNSIYIEDLNNLLAESGYSLTNTNDKKIPINYSELGKALLFAVLFIGFFILLQKLGIVNLVNANQITYPFIFLIGVIASLSTCMAVVGGLVLSISSAYVKADKNGSIPLVKFHIARLISFFILGGVIGILGSAFTLTTTTTVILNLVLFFVMGVLGLGLLDIFPALRKFQLRMPKALGSTIANTELKSYLTPVFLGILTFFLPCGFTQSMQLYSLTTGNFLNGALTMLVFALGTLPVLALISFASVKYAKGLQSKLFFKTSGFIVLFFALFNLLGALTALGVINPVFNF